MSKRTVLFNPSWVTARRIVEVRMQTRRVYQGIPGAEYVTLHDPVIVLDNGAEIAFVAEESPDGGEYGVQPVYRKPQES